MATHVADLSFVPTEAMSQFYCVKVSGDRTVDLNDTQGEKCIGIVQEAITAGDVANGRIVAVRTMGVSRAVASAAIAAGANVTGTNNGKVMTAASGDFVLGIALLSAAADGDQLEIQLAPHGVPLA